MKELLILLSLPTLGIGCLLFGPKDWEKTPKIIDQTQMQVDSLSRVAQAKLDSVDLLIISSQAQIVASQKAVNWQKSQVQYLQEKYGSSAPIR